MGRRVQGGSRFFKPFHLYHLIKIKPEILKYLGLEAGWKILYAKDYEDDWFDEELLII